ncbi:helix-turn-helix domain-containing protein [Streptomyces vinaceus]
MHLRYPVRIEATPGQRIALARTFGCARVVCNDALAARKAAYTADKSPIATGALARTVITETEKTPERARLAEGARRRAPVRGPRSGYGVRELLRLGDGAAARPKRRTSPVQSQRDSRQPVRFPKNGFRLRDNGRLNLAKTGDVRVPLVPAAALGPFVGDGGQGRRGPVFRVVRGRGQARGAGAGLGRRQPAGGSRHRPGSDRLRGPL